MAKFILCGLNRQSAEIDCCLVTHLSTIQATKNKKVGRPKEIGEESLPTNAYSASSFNGVNSLAALAISLRFSSLRGIKPFSVK